MVAGNALVYAGDGEKGSHERETACLNMRVCPVLFAYMCRTGDRGRLGR